MPEQQMATRIDLLKQSSAIRRSMGDMAILYFAKLGSRAITSGSG